MRFPFWPPRGASPVTPIEPWGKQFFVYNAPRGVELRGDARAPPLDDIRPRWLQDENAASMLLPGEGLDALGPPAHAEARTLQERRGEAQALESAPASSQETMLCATDFRQRPLLFLRPDEWSELLQQLPLLKEQMRQCQEEVNTLDERGAEMREYALRRKYIHDKHSEKKAGSMGKGSHFGRPYQTGKVGPRARERKVRVSTTELKRYSDGDYL